MKITPKEEVERRHAEERAVAATYADYDRAMESYLYDTRAARGYTDREPTDYATSSVTRWKQDAADWADFRDRVMVYGLEILNKFQAGEPVPTLEEFKAHLLTIEIHWTFEIAQ